MYKDKNIYGMLSMTAVALMLIGAEIIINSAVLMYLWKWFLVPMHAPPINLGTGAGLMIIARHLRGRLESSSDEDNDFAKVWAVGTLHAAVLLGMGFMIHQITF